MDRTRRQNLGDLPLETLQQIAGHLHDTHRGSLYAFSLANSRCHEATLPITFREIALKVRDHAALQRDVHALTEILSRADSARHVRHLKIKGFLSSTEEDIGDSEDEEGRFTLTRETAWFKTTGIGEILTDEEPILFAKHVCHEPVITKCSEEDVAWAPVVGLIKTLPHLATLVYDCRNQFPPSLLDVLHEHKPRCKLHHLTFRLRSLQSDVIDPYEMALATSPCLYSAKVANCHRDSVGNDDFNQEAMMELVAGLAPNLKEVMIMNFSAAGWWRFHDPRKRWKGLPGFVSGAGVGQLTSLSLVGKVRWSPGLLSGWAKHTDFRSLRRLTLGGGYRRMYDHGMDGNMMRWIVQNCSFPQLKALRVRLDRGQDTFEWPNYAGDAISLFRAFEPLDELSLTGPLEPEILDAILSRHGPTLKKLELRPIEDPIRVRTILDRRYVAMLLGKDHILQIQAYCPALEELSMPIKRTKSDAVEADTYKSLGRMERLKYLFLTLDCSECWLDRQSSHNPLFDEQDNECCHYYQLGWLQKGHLGNIFMNCAVDETLARSIWDTICQQKIGRQLQSLKLWTTGGGRLGEYHDNQDIRNIVDDLSRSWLIERVVEEQINVRELGRRGRKMRDQELTDRYNMGRPLTDTEALRVFRRVWPQKEGSEDWREDWSSLPLQA